MTKMQQQIAAGVAVLLIAAFALWLTKVNSTLEVIAVQITNVNTQISDMRQDSHREIDGVVKRVERLEAQR